MTTHLYIGLENIWIPDEDTDLREDLDYVRLSSTTFIRKCVNPHRYGNLLYIKHIKITNGDDEKDLLEAYPELEEWLKEWPRPVGRYEYSRTYDEQYTIDVIFGTDTKHKKKECVEYDPSWTDGEIYEYTNGLYGYWPRWTYDLKSAAVAEVVMKFVNELPPEKRLPHLIARHLASRANEKNCDCGLVYGSWDWNQIRTGQSPTVWKSTHHVFAKYLANGAKPIRYGQCWVFSEVLTSMYRYLGLPARTIFVDNARIDKGRDGGIDYSLSVSKGEEGGEFIPMNVNDFLATDLPKGIVYTALSQLEEEKNEPSSDEPEEEYIAKGDVQHVPEIDLRKLVGQNDSQWNFHVLTEVYLRRPDLTGDYSLPGWNCVDVSPCLPSDSSDEYRGNYLFGPCPVKAIRDCNPSNHDFTYLNSTFNSLNRFWTTQTFDGQTITYPYSIQYGHLRNSEISNVSVKTRDLYDSYGTSYIIPKDITLNYIHDKGMIYAYYHRLYPIMFAWGTKNNLSKLQRHEQASLGKMLDGPIPAPKPRPDDLEYRVVIRRPDELASAPHLVQICFFRNRKQGAQLLKCFRQVIDLDYPDITLPSVPEGTTGASFLTINLTTREWWPQVI